jgi:hypothetical protein
VGTGSQSGSRLLGAVQVRGSTKLPPPRTSLRVRDGRRRCHRAERGKGSAKRDLDSADAGAIIIASSGEGAAIDTVIARRHERRVFDTGRGSRRHARHPRTGADGAYAGQTSAAARVMAVALSLTRSRHQPTPRATARRIGPSRRQTRWTRSRPSSRPSRGASGLLLRRQLDRQLRNVEMTKAVASEGAAGRRLRLRWSSRLAGSFMY